MIRRDRALAILHHCSGDEIWSIEHCRGRGVPDDWIDRLADAFESNFFDDRQTIYVGVEATNQYHGVRDVDLALEAGRALRLDVERLRAHALNRRHLVRLIKEAVAEGE